MRRSNICYILSRDMLELAKRNDKQAATGPETAQAAEKRSINMKNNQKISFPITLEEFTRLQWEATHRTPTAAERELYKECVEFANVAYNVASMGDMETATDMTLFKPDSLYGNKEAEKLFQDWVILGINAGLEALRATEEAAKAD